MAAIVWPVKREGSVVCSNRVMLRYTALSYRNRVVPCASGALVPGRLEQHQSHPTNSLNSPKQRESSAQEESETLGLSHPIRVHRRRHRPGLVTCGSRRRSDPTLDARLFCVTGLMGCSTSTTVLGLLQHTDRNNQVAATCGSAAQRTSSL